MEKVEIKLTFDNERMDALAFYLAKEDTDVQRKMDEALRQLYEQAVPEPVREYLDAKTAPPKPKRPPRPSRAKTDPPKTQSLPTEDQAGVENP